MGSGVCPSSEFCHLSGMESCSQDPEGRVIIVPAAGHKATPNCTDELENVVFNEE